jgi:hypothetical protein
MRQPKLQEKKKEKKMSKKKRKVIGSVCKSKDGGPDYIKMRESGKTYRLESAAQQLASLEKALADGKLSPEIGDQVRERIQKTPPWVRFEIIELVDAD